MWNPLRASSVGETNCGGPGGSTVAPVAAAASAATVRSQTLFTGGRANSDNNSNLLQPSLPCSRGNHSSSADDGSAVFPNFERGAAIASVGTASITAGSAGGVVAGRSTSSHEYLLAEASCSSLPEPLVFGGSAGTGMGTASAVAAVSTDSGDAVEGGGFWNPLLQQQSSGEAAGAEEEPYGSEIAAGSTAASLYSVAS